MNFEDFKTDIEAKFNSVCELIEFHFQPFIFGSGIVAYLIKGRFHKFIYDGRDNLVIWLVSKEHQKYLGVDFIEFKKFNGLIITLEELEKGINIRHNDQAFLWIDAINELLKGQSPFFSEL